MRLYYTDTSPFVRKVRIAAFELGLADRLELVFLRPTPVAPSEQLSSRNPLSKIPALEIGPELTLYDSRVIVEWLDHLVPPEQRLIPAEGTERWRALRVQALCDGILDAGILAFYEGQLRPAELRWDAWVEGQLTKVKQGLDVLESEVLHFAATVQVDQIAAAATVGWLQFRRVGGDVFKNRPQLEAWFSEFSERESMKATVPVG